MEADVNKRLQEVRTKVASWLVSILPKEKRASECNVVKVARRIHKGESVNTAVRAVCPHLDDSQVKRATDLIVSRSKQAWYPGCKDESYQKHMRGKKKSKKD